MYGFWGGWRERERLEVADVFVDACGVCALTKWVAGELLMSMAGAMREGAQTAEKNREVRVKVYCLLRRKT